MGRPVNKNKIGSDSGRIAVSRYFFTGASELSAPQAWIVNQRSTSKFTITDGSSTEVMQLTDDAGGGLTAGQFAIDITLNDSTVVQVTKLKNRTVTYDDTSQIWYAIGTGIDDGDNETDQAIIAPLP